MDELPHTHPDFGKWRRSLRENDAQARAAKHAPSPAIFAEPIEATPELEASTDLAMGVVQEAPAYRAVVVRGQTLQLVPADALALFGALAQAVDGETARITLASGDVLELTHQDVSDIGRQLAGKPADEVSGSDRETGS